MFLYRQIVSIKAGEKIINGNMIKRNEELKNKRTKRKKDSISHKGYIRTVGEGGGQTHRKKILTSKKKFFLNFQNLENPNSWWGRG